MSLIITIVQIFQLILIAAVVTLIMVSPAKEQFTSSNNSQSSSQQHQQYSLVMYIFGLLCFLCIGHGMYHKYSKLAFKHNYLTKIEQQGNTINLDSIWNGGFDLDTLDTDVDNDNNDANSEDSIS